jgi:peptidoglycan LD-endopeptidase LytH
VVKRVLVILLCLATLLGLLYLARVPLQRMRTIVRLYREDLQAPLVVPVAGLPRSRLSNNWGEPRGGGRRHEGIDIFARCGHPVVSATEGVVTSVGENGLGGRVVWVLGPGGSMHYYAHLGRYAEIKRWDLVRPGDPVGYVGNTGNAAGGPCHLHYGIYLNGGAINPYPLLRLRAPAPRAASLQEQGDAPFTDGATGPAVAAHLVDEKVINAAGERGSEIGRAAVQQLPVLFAVVEVADRDAVPFSGAEIPVADLAAPGFPA